MDLDHTSRLQMTTQLDIDAIAREAALAHYGHNESGENARLIVLLQERIAAAIRRAIQEVVMPAEIKEQARLIDERDALKRENAELNKALALKFDAMPSGLSAGQSIRLEKQLAEAKADATAAVNGMLDLKRTNQMLAEQLHKHAEAIAERDALTNVAKAADELEALLRKNTGRTDDWPIEIKVSGDYAKQLAGKLTAMTRALKPYRKAKNAELSDRH